MNRFYFFAVLVFTILSFSTFTVIADSQKSHFASVLVNGKKVGQVHYTVRQDHNGILQELKTRASLSVFGLEVYHHTLHTHELWVAGEMKHLWGSVNDHGKQFQIDLTKFPEQYSGTINQQSIELPSSSFPTAVWHYAITAHTQLFSIPELTLLKVKISKSSDTVKIGNKEVDAEKFSFSGDWHTTIWYDFDKQFLKWEYKVKGRTVTVVLDP